jgi:hypothetical protein
VLLCIRIELEVMSNGARIRNPRARRSWGTRAPDTRHPRMPSAHRAACLHRVPSFLCVWCACVLAVLLSVVLCCALPLLLSLPA